MALPQVAVVSCSAGIGRWGSADSVGVFDESVRILSKKIMVDRRIAVHNHVVKPDYRRREDKEESSKRPNAEGVNINVIECAGQDKEVGKEGDGPLRSVEYNPEEVVEVGNAGCGLLAQAVVQFEYA